MSNPFFSVIIPTYNREAFVSTSIQSVIDQINQDFELLIIDDGSTDGTFEVIKSLLSDKVHYHKIENSERGAARNLGMVKATGEYITFLDSDDIYYANYLSNAYECLNKMKYPDFFHQPYEIKTENGSIIGVTRPSSSNVYKAISKGNFMSCMGVFIKREVTRKFKFNEDRELSGSEDWEYWVRLMAAFGLKTDTEVCSAMIVHEDRSVLAVTESSLLRRKNLAMKCVFQDEQVKRVFGKYKNYMSANWDTYIALHLMLDFQSNSGINYLLKAIKIDPIVLFDKRSLSILKMYVFNLLGLRKKNEE